MGNNKNNQNRTTSAITTNTNVKGVFIMRKILLISLSLLMIFLLAIGCTTKDSEDGKNQDQTGNQVDDDTNNQAGVNIPAIDEMIVSAENWKDKFPLIYNSFITSSEVKDDVVEDNDLGGQHPIDYLKKYPNIVVLYEGMGFAKEYYKARGHYYALDDVINISRPKPGAACLSCKTGELERLHVVNGNNLFAMDFQQTVQDVENGITCYNCHRNQPGEAVHTIAPHFNAAIGKLATEPKSGTLACAQCHVEYYMNPENKEVILPWENGTEIGEIEAYYDNIGFADWEHPRTGTPLIKVQHPEFEMSQGSIHANMGVTCADCHMPTLEQNGEQYKSHWPTSPLKATKEACGRCHNEESESLITRVEKIQQNVEAKEVQVSDLLVKLINDFATAIEERRLDDNTIDQVRNLHRRAQYRWDFVFVENSTGFHNQQKSLNALEEAKQYAQQAIDIIAQK